MAMFANAPSPRARRKGGVLALARAPSPPLNFLFFNFQNETVD
jgi:hypothetical protein